MVAAHQAMNSASVTVVHLVTFGELGHSHTKSVSVFLQHWHNYINFIRLGCVRFSEHLHHKLTVFEEAL